MFRLDYYVVVFCGHKHPAHLFADTGLCCTVLYYFTKITYILISWKGGWKYLYKKEKEKEKEKKRKRK
jgi:hypothetical protein